MSLVFSRVVCASQPQNTEWYGVGSLYLHISRLRIKLHQRQNTQPAAMVAFLFALPVSPTAAAACKARRGTSSSKVQVPYSECTASAFCLSPGNALWHFLTLSDNLLPPNSNLGGLFSNDFFTLKHARRTKKNFESGRMIQALDLATA
jgi:hypothetical protein